MEERAEIRFNLPFLNFEGPLDLLLHLVRKNRLDIHEIPVSELTSQYLEYLELLRILNVEVASEFLVMASTLIYIKSRALLPVHEGLEEEEDPEEMRRELSRKLIEYEKYKEAAEALGENPMMRRDVFKREEISELEKVSGDALPVTEVSLVDLLSAFRKVLTRVGGDLTQDISAERLSIADAMTFIMDRMEGNRVVKFSELIEDITTRKEAVAFFLAILELAKLGGVGLYQGEPFGDITIITRGEES